MIRAMLQAFHKLSTSPGARVLFAVLLFAFVIFGIGDVLRQRGGDSTVAVVGGEDLSSDQLMSAFNNVTHGKIDPATARKMGVLNSVLNSMIDDTLARRAAIDDGMVVGKPEILDMIAKIPQLRDDKTGEVDRAKFHEMLAAQHWSEADLIDYLQHQTMLRLIGEAQLGPVHPPKILVDALYGYAREQRRGSIIRVLDAAMPVPTPTADELTKYYHAHESSYQAPEYRSFSFLALSPTDLVKGVTVSPDEVRKEYDAHADRFTVPDRRDVVQLMVADEAPARQVSALVKAGKSLEEAGKAAGVSAAPQDMGLAAKTDLPQPLQEPVFAAQAGQTLDPVQTDFGWDVLTVKRIEPGHVLPFEQIHDEIETNLKTAAARDKLADEAKKIDDQLSGGASLAEAGKPVGLTPVQVNSVDASGLPAKANPIISLKNHDDILKAAFQSTKDTSPQIQDGADGSVFAVQVTNVTPPALKAFDDVRGEVTKAYIAQAKGDLAKHRAEDFLKRYQSGTPFAAIAKDLDLTPSPVGPVNRMPKDKGTDRDVLKTLFSLSKPNEAGIAQTTDGPVLVLMTDITPARTVDPIDAATLTSSVSDQMQKDNEAAYELALRKAYDVKINDKVLTGLTGGD